MFERFKKPTYIELPKGFLKPPYRVLIKADVVLKIEDIQEIENSIENFIIGKKRTLLVPPIVKELLIFDNDFNVIYKMQR